MKKNNALEVLEKTYELRSDYYQIYYDFFEYEKNKDNLTLDEKFVAAGYLLDIEVTLHNGKYHGYPGKKANLFEFFADNIRNVSEESLDKVHMHIEKQVERKRSEQELEIKENYPEIYNELMT